jgi:hypothetical protein
MINVKIPSFFFIFNSFAYAAPKVISVRVGDIEKELIIAKARLAASEASMGSDTQRKFFVLALLAEIILYHHVVTTCI